MPRDTRRRFLDAIAGVEPAIAEAFERAIMDVRSAAQLRSIEAAIQRGFESGNIVRAVQEVQAALNLGEAFFAPLDRQIVEAFIEGGAYQVGLLPKRPPNTAPRLVARFDQRNPRAEAWTRRNTGRLITEIEGSIRDVVRETVTEGFEQNRGYRNIALDLIGRTEGNERKGGLVGLHSRQAAAVRKARAELEALDPAYFQRERRDRRFDGPIRKAIREGKPLSQSEIDRYTGRYADRMLQLRGATIARTEGNKAAQAGRTEAVQQLIDSGKVPATAVTKIWDAVIGPRTRDHHVELNGTEIAWGERFISPETGFPMEYPHDENAPGADTVNCRCTMRTRIDYTRLAR